MFHVEHHGGKACSTWNKDESRSNGGGGLVTPVLFHVEQSQGSEPRALGGHADSPGVQLGAGPFEYERLIVERLPPLPQGH
jgi:hypothetical protein